MFVGCVLVSRVPLFCLQLQMLSKLGLLPTLHFSSYVIVRNSLSGHSHTTRKVFTIDPGITVHRFLATFFSPCCPLICGISHSLTNEATERAAQKTNTCKQSEQSGSEHQILDLWTLLARTEWSTSISQEGKRPTQFLLAG